MIFSHPRLFNFSVSHQTLLLASGHFHFFNYGITEWQKVKLAPASFKESWKRTWWLERARLYARPIPRRPRTCILTLPRGARRPFEEMEGWGLGWGGGIGLWGWGRFSRQPSSPPCPLGPGCQTQNCLKTSASSPRVQSLYLSGMGPIFCNFLVVLLSWIVSIPCSSIESYSSVKLLGSFAMSCQDFLV